MFTKLVFYFLLMMTKKMGPNAAKRVVSLGLKSQIFQPQKYLSERLRTRLMGKEHRSPLGLASDFDRNGKFFDFLVPLGISFGELGSFTLLAESSKEKYMFLLKDKALYIQGATTPNPGISKAVQILASRRKYPAFIGATLISFGSEGEAYKTSSSAVFGYNNDYHQMAMRVAPYVDYVCLNFSHPNMSLAQMLSDESTILPMLLDIKGALQIAAPLRPPKLVVKVPYDLSELEVKLIASTCQKSFVDAIIVAGPATANRQIRTILKRKSALSMDSSFVTGAPLKKDVLQLVKRFYLETKGEIDIIATGGIFTAQDVYDAIAHGANAVELCSALIYKGPEVISKINKDLTRLLEKHNTSIQELRGTKVDLDEFWDKESKKGQMNIRPEFVD
ncbi:MAG: hypothetical protein J6V53_05415 [Alphaproteobacteria bacterium]|nr:hypothetical protein [Alphaproteobacteria bacterium]